MAGSFFHLWLADRVLAGVRADMAGVRADMATPVPAACFRAGSLAPDLGYFPGGSSQYSDLVHRHRAAGFCRALRRQAAGDCERAFADGWALHLHADLLIHPWVDRRVRALAAVSPPLPGYPDLWHMQVEWGADCRLLERADARALWHPLLRFPTPEAHQSSPASPGPLLRRISESFHGPGTVPPLAAAQRSLCRWTARLPRLLYWFGKVRPEGRTPVPLVTEALDRLTRALFGGRLARLRACKTIASLARPWPTSGDDMAQLSRLADEVLATYAEDRAAAFARLPDADFGTGRRVAASGSRSPAESG